EDIRRLFHSRVVAEWLRQRGGGPFAAALGRGDASTWHSREPWTPREIWERYVRSATQGEWRVERETPRPGGIDVRVMAFGGVDLTRLLATHVDYDGLVAERPALEQQIAEAVLTRDGYENAAEAWLGGVYVQGLPVEERPPE